MHYYSGGYTHCRSGSDSGLNHRRSARRDVEFFDSGDSTLSELDVDGPLNKKLNNMHLFAKNSLRYYLRNGFRRVMHDRADDNGSDVPRGPSAVSGHEGEGGYKMYRTLTFFVALPAIAFCAFHCYLLSQHEPHKREPFVPYEYMRRRTKRFPWGDGQRSLFHNPKVNPLPDGYETEEDEDD